VHDDKPFLRMVSTDGTGSPDREGDSGGRGSPDECGGDDSKKGMVELANWHGRRQRSHRLQAEQLRARTPIPPGDPAAGNQVSRLHGGHPKRSKSAVKIGRDSLLDGMRKMTILSSDTYRV